MRTEKIVRRASQRERLKATIELLQIKQRAIGKALQVYDAARAENIRITTAAFHLRYEA